MKRIIVTGLTIEFDGDDGPAALARLEVKEALDAINLVLQREPEWLAAQIMNADEITDANITVQFDEDGDD